MLFRQGFIHFSTVALFLLVFYIYNVHDCIFVSSYYHATFKSVIGQNAGQCLDFRESFDVAVARAVAEMRVLGMLMFNCTFCFHKWCFELYFFFLLLILLSFTAEYCLPLVRVGGLFVAAKGYNPQVLLIFAHSYAWTHHFHNFTL